jgi:hypothetical protein
MRGRKSSHRELLRSAPSRQAGGGDSTRALDVTCELNDLPISAQELDAIEAFLMPQILRLLETEQPTTDDSKLPKTPEIVPQTEGAQL